MRNSEITLLMTVLLPIAQVVIPGSTVTGPEALDAITDRERRGKWFHKSVEA
jgi:hypothetical protein